MQLDWCHWNFEAWIGFLLIFMTLPFSLFNFLMAYTLASSAFYAFGQFLSAKRFKRFKANLDKKQP